ncbi:kinase-like domain-containing protein [Annulohypoxylon moriforme]|nr:kinase-like domain-containing protein [Annulohypoxylon moriforme]
MEPTGDPYPTQDTGTRPLPEDIDLLPGEFGTRYEIALPYEENQSIVSWKEGFEGPEIFVNDPNGRRRVTNKSDFIRPRTFTASDSIESEGESSVISVDDLGFSDAPTESLPQFRDFCNHLEKNQACSKTEPFMSVEELRLHLGCSEGPANTIEELIGNKMEESFEKSKQDNEDYLPLDAFEAIFDIEAIKSLVKETYSKDTEPNLKEMIAHIIGNEPNQGYRRILGALVLMNQVIRIQDFIKEGIRDYDLPIKRSPQDNKGFDTRTGIYNDTLFQGWSRNDIELFYVYQKKLFVPFFNIQEDKLCSYVFDSNVRLPWKDFEQKTSGGNGLVHRVEIHSKHHNFRPSNNLQKPLYFALKEIFTLDRDAYRRELWALEKSVAHAQRENHLIKLLLTFQHGEVCYLLFEWADGNLADFWEQIEIAPALSDTWAVDQCLGISNAIKRIHGLATWQKRRRSSRGSESDNERDWGRHGDIKPNNILWFSVYTTDSNETLHDHLVVSDLGLTRYHSQDTRSAVHRSHLEGCTWGYRPPEMDTERLISSSYDIWSLGCVFLEFCVWYINGGKAVQIFGIEREKQDESEIRGVFEDKYFNITTDEHGRRQVCLKPIVEEYLNTRLRESDRYTPFVEHMLNLIQHKMLVIDPKERWKIDRICTEIFNIKSEIAKIETPVAEPAHAVDALLRVADQGVSNLAAHQWKYILICS